MSSVDSPPARSNTIAVGLAMFSMFFGAGNVVFPLMLGQHAQEHVMPALFGLIITGVGVPFIGLLAMTLFNGNSFHFFERMGKIPGFAIAAAIMFLIGPFGATPRTVTLAYGTMRDYMPGVDLATFTALACLLIFFLTFRKGRILDILGYVLTPVLLGSLALIIVIGLLTSRSLAHTSHTAIDAFTHGLSEGYQTMDLLASFFFSSVVLHILEQGLGPRDHNTHRRMIFKTMKGGCIGMGLLAVVYGGFCVVAAFHSPVLEGVAPEAALATLATSILGSKAAIVAHLAVALACLTTAIALVAVFADFLQVQLLRERISYLPAVVATLASTFCMSMLDFSGIIAFLGPILQVCYPSLIVLSVCNLLHKLRHFHPVKIPVYGTFGLSLASYLLG